MDRVHTRLSLANFSTQDSAAHDRFTRIYARDSPFVRSVLVRFGVPKRDVDDLMHEVFVAVWRHLEGIDAHREIRPWLYTVAANLTNNYRRLRRHHQESFVEEMPDGVTVSGDLDWVIDASRRLRRIMRQVGPKSCEVVLRVGMEGRSVQEVAAELGKSPKTVHLQMQSVRERLRRQSAY